MEVDVDLGDGFIQKLKYYESGNILSISYLKEDGDFYVKNDFVLEPSFSSYYENGTIKEEVYWKDNMLHRDGNKPAYIRYNNKGEIDFVEYWVDDKLLETDVIERLKRLDKRKNILKRLL